MKNKMKVIYSLAIVALCVPCFALSSLPFDETDYMGSEACEDCHEMSEKVSASIHGKLAAHEMDSEQTCESCHGPGGVHVESFGEEAIPHPFNEETRQKDVARVCVTCHIGGTTMAWYDSEHSAQDVLCLDCHDVKEPYRKRSSKEQTKLCESCHADQIGKFMLPSRHPVLENLMSCVDCHNPHGGEESMLLQDNVNDLCWSCHADKHGPFLYEHEPVMEDCLYCHEAKGAMHDNLLKANEGSLCLRCHAVHEDVHPASHLNTGTSRSAFMTKCTRCHSQIHGSDLPGFAGPGRFIR